MPQVTVNSTNIDTFAFSVSFDIQNQTVLFDSSATVYNGSGISSILGIAFSFQDSLGIDLLTVDWTAPQISPSFPAGSTYTLDLSSSTINFLFQTYKIIGYIKDADGTVYSTEPVLKKVGQPAGVNESGYVDGNFQIISDCINNTITVKEFTTLIYCNKSALSVSKTGTLYYPQGTLSPVSFTGTPFSNDQVFTGTYKINCATVATYDLDDNVYVLVTYLTASEFNITCSNFIGDIACCLTDAYNTYKKNCENAIGAAALQRYNSVLPSVLNGIVKQINGQDASTEVSEIKKLLKCDCGAGSLKQNEATPTNPAVNSIILSGVGDISIPSATINGNTKTFYIAGNSFSISKGNTGDLAFTITLDQSIQYLQNYKITFNYDIEAKYNLDAIAASPTLLNQLNSLITSSGASITGLDGKCVIDLTTANYSVSQTADVITTISNIVINGITYAAPAFLYAIDTVSVAAWLNSLTLGTYSVVYSSGIVTIQSVANTNTIATITFASPAITKQFSATNATLLQVFQAIINYVCNLTSLQIALARQLTLCTFDYNGSIVQTTYATDNTQNDFNAGVASAICNITSRISSLSDVTCAKLKTLFIDRSGVAFGGSDRLYGTLGGNCASLSDLEIANIVIAAVSKYDAVKLAWCAIDCSSTGTCPDISNTSIGMSGSNIGVYGLTWSSVPVASQTVTVKYRINGTLTYNVATSALLILPNGNISGSSPYLITGLSAGTTYDVFIQNNCGGAGFVKQITTPTGSVYTGSYYLENILYDICGSSPVTLYSSQPFASGIIMYTDIGLTTPVTGYTYITVSGSNIYGLNTVTGVVGIDTGSSCSNGVAASYSLGNSTATICTVTPVSLYTNGTFAIGKVLYTDAALTNPQLGYSYAVYGGTIYTVNSGTGAITGTTGLSCLNYSLTAAYNFSINSVTGTGVPTLPATGTNGSQSGHHTAMSGNYAVVISGSVVTTTKIYAIVNGTVVSCLAVSAAGTYNLTIAAAETDSVIISIGSGVC